jgi:hypothetical protein
VDFFNEGKNDRQEKNGNTNYEENEYIREKK